MSLDSSIQSELDNLSMNELKQLINSQKSRKQFVEDVSPWAIEKSVEDKLSSFSISYESLSESQKQLLISMSDTKTIIQPKDIEDLFFGSNPVITNTSDKVLFIKTFLPVVSVQDLIDWKILNSQQVKQFVDSEYESILKDFDLDSLDFEDFWDRFEPKDMLISTLNFDDDIVLDKILKNNGLKNFVKELNQIKNDIQTQAEAEIDKNGPQTLEEFRDNLSTIDTTGKFENIKNFKEWNVIKFSYFEIEEWQKVEKVDYVKIIKADDSKRTLTLVSVGKWNVIQLNNTQAEEKIISYWELFEVLKTTKKSLEFIDRDILKQQVLNPNSNLHSSELELHTISDIENNWNEYKDFYKSKLQDEIDNLEDDIETKWWKDLNPLMTLRLEKKKDDLTRLNDSSIDNQDLLEFVNLQKLIEKLDEIDEEGKNLWLEKGIFLHTEKKDEKWVYEVVGIQNGNILLKSARSQLEVIDFVSFFESFKENNTKRIVAIQDFWNYIDQTKKWDDGWNKLWDKHEIQDGKIYAQDVEYQWKTGKQEVDFLVSNKNNDVIKINHINWNNVTVQFWERKDFENLTTSEKKKSGIESGSKWESISLDSSEVTMNINELDIYIQKFELYPKWKTWKTVEPDDIQDIQNDFKGKFSTRLFNKTSFNELIMWGKMFIESIQETMKKWNELHAAKFALSMWEMLPDEIKAELKIKVERQENEEMEKALESLGKIDSWEAIKRIRWWLENKNTPEYKKEAWLMFMVSKYGLLYAKWPLGYKKGTFLWYEAFGGRINDALYQEEKEKAEATDIPFTEERLMYVLLNKQCKTEWFNGIKRRWRLYKEYDGKISWGIKDEMDKGIREADAMRTFWDRNGNAKGEFKWGEFNNGLWKYKSAVNRWAPLHDLNELPFMILFSWVWYLLQEEQLNEFKNFAEWNKFWGLLFTRFLGETSGMKVFSETVLKLSEKFEDKESEKFKWMYDEALSIYTNQHSSKLSIREKMNKAEDFWKKYGKALSRTMLRLNNQDDTYKSTDKILMTEQEDLHWYNKALDWYLWWADFSDKWIMDDQFKKQWVSGLWTKVFSQIGETTTEWTFRNWPAALNIWKEIVWEIDNTKDAEYETDNEKNRELQIKNIENQLKTILSYLKKRESQQNLMKNLKNWLWDLWYDLKRLWINNYIDDLQNFSSEELEQLQSKKVKKFVRGIAINILDGNIGNLNFSGFETSPIEDIIWISRDSVQNTVNN